MYFTMQKIEKTALQNTFFLAHSQNINAIPVNQDKKPACKSWGQWQTQPQTLEESQKHSNGSSAGIAVITGTASGGLESIDFDQMEVYQVMSHQHLALISARVSFHFVRQHIKHFMMQVLLLSLLDLT